MVHRAKRSRWVNVWHWFVLKLFKRSAEWSISCRRVHEHKRTWVCFSVWESTLPIGQICTSSWQINNACQLKVKKLLNRLNFIHLHGFPFIFTGFAVSGSMLHLKAKEFSTDPAFKASLGWYQNWKRRHSVSFPADNASPATARRHGGENCAVQPLHSSSQATSWVSFIQDLQHGWDTDALRTSINTVTGVHWQPNGSGKNLRTRKVELHCHTCRRCGWNKTSTQGHL